MTILVLKLPEQMARRVAMVADQGEYESHEDVGLEALRLFLESTLGKVKGRKPMSSEAKRRR